MSSDSDVDYRYHDSDSFDNEIYVSKKQNLPKSNKSVSKKKELEQSKSVKKSINKKKQTKTQEYNSSDTDTSDKEVSSSDKKQLPKSEKKPRAKNTSVTKSDKKPRAKKEESKTDEDTEVSQTEKKIQNKKDKPKTEEGSSSNIKSSGINQQIEVTGPILNLINDSAKYDKFKDLSNEKTMSIQQLLSLVVTYCNDEDQQLIVKQDGKKSVKIDNKLAIVMDTEVNNIIPYDSVQPCIRGIFSTDKIVINKSILALLKSVAGLKPKFAKYFQVKYISKTSLTEAIKIYCEANSLYRNKDKESKEKFKQEYQQAGYDLSKMPRGHYIYFDDLIHNIFKNTTHFKKVTNNCTQYYVSNKDMEVMLQELL